VSFPYILVFKRSIDVIHLTQKRHYMSAVSLFLKKFLSSLHPHKKLTLPNRYKQSSNKEYNKPDKNYNKPYKEYNKPNKK